MKISIIILFINFVSIQIFAESKIDLELASLAKKFNLKSLDNVVVQNSSAYLLGSKLFSDKILSGNRNISCRECHSPVLGTSDGLPFSIGEGGIGLGSLRLQEKAHTTPRNSPALYNLGYKDIPNMFWDGRVEWNGKSFKTPEKALNGTNPKRSDIVNALKSVLAAQVIFPLTSHEEMRGQKLTNEIADAKNNEEVWQLLLLRVLENPEYKTLLEKAWPNEKYNIGHIASSLAEFIAVKFNKVNTPYDRYLKGDLNAMTFEEKLGMKTFIVKAKCVECHRGPHLSQFTYESSAIPELYLEAQHKAFDWGRYEVSLIEREKFLFRVPALRNVAKTAPYMHNGVFSNLREVVNHYNNIRESLLGYKAKNWENYNSVILVDDDQERMMERWMKIRPRRHFHHGISLTEKEKMALVQFLELSLTDDSLR